MNDNKKLEEMEENFEQTENSGAGGMKWMNEWMNVSANN
jgi:hypothetical protein